MKKLILVVLVLTCCTGAFAAVKVGSTLAVSDNDDECRWVAVANPKGIDNGNGHFAFGEEAILGTTFGTLKVIALDGDRVLCRYQTKNRVYGTECPSGAIFFLGKSDFQRMLANYEEIVRQERAERKKMAEYLRKEKAKVKALLGKS